ncbi:MAG: FecR family protein [Treponema sp.]|nr:FecR family protein [Treponema sp.]
MKSKIFLAVLPFLLAGWSLAAQEARFAELNGTVETQEAGTREWRPAVVGGLIGKNTVISTGIKSSAVISLGASTVTVSPLTMLTLEELIQRDDSEDAVLYLRTGRVKADVSPPSGLRADFTIRSPTTTASVRGTSFTFDGKRLAVHSGKVRFAGSSGQTVYVNGKQRSYTDEGRLKRLVPPVEAGVSQLRPELPELSKTGKGGSAQKPGTVSVGIDVDWL